MCPIPSAGGVSSVGHAFISLLTRPMVSVVVALAYTLESVESDSDACSQHSTSASHNFIKGIFPTQQAHLHLMQDVREHHAVFPW
jgi:hypothetical protein